MESIKGLISGKLSLAVTFWGYGVLCNIFFVLLGLWSFSIHSIEVLLFTLILKWIVSIMVLSGIFFILRNKGITVWAIIAFILMLLNFLNSTIFLIAVSMVIINPPPQ